MNRPHAEERRPRWRGLGVRRQPLPAGRRGQQMAKCGSRELGLVRAYEVRRSSGERGGATCPHLRLRHCSCDRITMCPDSSIRGAGGSLRTQGPMWKLQEGTPGPRGTPGQERTVPRAWLWSGRSGSSPRSTRDEPPWPHPASELQGLLLSQTQMAAASAASVRLLHMNIYEKRCRRLRKSPPEYQLWI